MASALEFIGSTGKAAFAAIKEGVSSASQGASEAGKSVQRFGQDLRDVSSKAADAKNVVQDMGSSFVSVGIKIGAAFAAVSAAIALVGNQASKAAKQVNDQADKAKGLGVTPDQLKLMNELGVETKNLELAFAKLQKEMNDVANGTAGADNILKQYNIRVKDGANGMRAVRDVAADLAAKIKVMGGNFQQTGIYVVNAADGMNALSSVVVKFNPFVAQTSSLANNLKAVGTAAETTGQQIENLSIARLAKSGKAIEDYNFAVNQFEKDREEEAKRTGQTFIPMMVDAEKALMDAYKARAKGAKEAAQASSDAGDGEEDAARKSIVAGDAALEAANKTSEAGDKTAEAGKKIAATTASVVDMGKQAKISAEMVRAFGQGNEGIGDALIPDPAKLKEANEAIGERAKLDAQDRENAK